MAGRALILVVWAIASLVFFVINPVWGTIVFLLGFLILALAVAIMQAPARRSGSRDINIHIIEDEERGVRRQPRRSGIQTGLDWHVPKINKDDMEFITGARSIRKSQREAMRRVKKRLWGD